MPDVGEHACGMKHFFYIRNPLNGNNIVSVFSYRMWGKVNYWTVQFLGKTVWESARNPDWRWNLYGPSANNYKDCLGTYER